ncbi:MAG TPA: DUF444 family protein [Clostridiaceae bacterium]
MAIFRELNPIIHERAIEDINRHKKLVEKAIKANLPELLSEESIIVKEKSKKIKVPIKGLKEYSFIYGNNISQIGIGSGSEKKGERISGAGNILEDDMYETEVTIEDIMNYFFDDMSFPNISKKNGAKVAYGNTIRIKGYKKYGIRPRLSKKKTAIERLKRRKSSERRKVFLEEKKEAERFPFNTEDLRYHKIKYIRKKQYNAVVFCIMDTSGSMDTTKKYLARSFFFFLYQFIKMKYEGAEIVFISHTTEAREVNEEEFFHKVEAGGTYISSGIKKALEIIEERYNPLFWNIYSFHVTDGDNWMEDNENTISYARKLSDVCNLFGYAEIMPAAYYSTIKKRLETEINNTRFLSVTIKGKDDLWSQLKELLSNEIKEV